MVAIILGVQCASSRRKKPVLQESGDPHPHALNCVKKRKLGAATILPVFGHWCSGCSTSITDSFLCLLGLQGLLTVKGGDKGGPARAVPAKGPGTVPLSASAWLFLTVRQRAGSRSQFAHGPETGNCPWSPGNSHSLLEIWRQEDLLLNSKTIILCQSRTCHFLIN